MAGRDTLSDIKEFVVEQNVGQFEHLIDGEDRALWNQFGIRSQPAFVFIDDDGTFEAHQGSLGEAALTERVEALIAR